MEHLNNIDQIIWNIYAIILLYFLLGGIGFYIINRNKPSEIARKSYVKYFTYAIIINCLFFSIVVNPVVFRYLVVFIICIGIIELVKLFVQSGFQKRAFFILSLVVYCVLANGFYEFTGISSGLVLYSFLITSIFDSFSQITGQIWGKHKILPKISPHKTVEGVMGGAIIAILTSGIVAFAFLGDILASFYKRRYQVKDFSRLIPGHGGFLDRFDSLIASGAWVAIYFYLL